MNDDGRELGAFLRARRARVSPESMGLTVGPRRRVAGLRREELAQLAAISVDYYVRLEQGRATQPSDEVLDALADVLDLDGTERDHLRRLARTRRARPRPAPRPERLSPELRRVLEGMTGMPAVIMGDRLDLLAWNRLGSELFGGLDDGARDRNQARYLFLDPRSRETFPDHGQRTRETVAVLRLAVGRDLDDPGLAELVEELSVHSREFRAMWAAGDVMVCERGLKRFRHPAVGELRLRYETLHVPASDGQPGQQLYVHLPEQGGDAETALRLLEAWIAPAGDERRAGRR
ncbi:helix-turn-helix transcriptional regulator [Actinoallomurus acanthiterrae]